MNEYYINYRYKDSKRFAAVKAYTPLQAVYFLSRNTGRWYILKDFKAGRGNIEVCLREGTEQLALF